jgi:hypothetical protein
MTAVDPYAVLGVRPGAAEREVAAAYRELAKRWHPDRAHGAPAGERDRRMAEINAAYAALRTLAGREGTGHGAPPGPAPAPAANGARRPRPGWWLPDAVRRALGPELLDALAQREVVRLVTPASAWASPRAVLAVTERRLLDDAPVARVRSLSLRDVAAVEYHLRRPRRRVATLSVRTHAGRRHAFTGLRPHTAATIERHIREALDPPAHRRG